MTSWFVTDLNKMDDGLMDDGGVFLVMEESFFGCVQGHLSGIIDLRLGQ